MKNLAPVLLGCLLLNPIASSAEWQLIWSDEFDGDSLDLNTWNVEVNGLGGYNEELQYYTGRPENIKVENGHLVLTGRRETYTGPRASFDSTLVERDYTSARINSQTKREFHYGKIEASIRLPAGNGVFPAFWMMGSGGSWPANGEIDIMELVGGTQCLGCGDDVVYATAWYEDGGQKSIPSETYRLSSGKFADNFHLFSVEWDENSIRWFVDGNQYHSHDISGPEFSEFHQPFYILLNFAIGGEWPGSPDDTTVFPQEMLVDYVRVYKQVAAVGETPVPEGPSRLVNLSIRTRAGEDDESLIVGFVVDEGTAPDTKSLLVRAAGPTLNEYGVTGALPDPTLVLAPLNQSALASNDNWGGSDPLATASARVGAFPFSHAGSLDAALLSAVPTGAYTAQVSGKGTSAGVALVEVYDVEKQREPRLVNLSARSRAGANEDALIAGFVVEGQDEIRLLVRAVGPTLQDFGVNGVLPDPTLSIRPLNSDSVLAENDNWNGDEELKTAFTTAGAFELTSEESRDAAVVLEIPAGAYTATVQDRGSASGVALVEVYELR